MRHFLVALCVARVGALLAPASRPHRAVRVSGGGGDDAVDALALRLDALEAEVASLRAWQNNALNKAGAALEELRAAAGAGGVAAYATPNDSADARRVAKLAEAGGGLGAPASVGRAAGLVDTMAARAALGAVRGIAPAGTGGAEAKNDVFLDDDLEDLLEIGGDPFFLAPARDGAPPPPPFEGAPAAADGDLWDGVIDETAYFDD